MYLCNYQKNQDIILLYSFAASRSVFSFTVLYEEGSKNPLTHRLLVAHQKLIHIEHELVKSALMKTHYNL